MTKDEALRLALEALEWQQKMLYTAMQYSAAKGMTFLGHPPNPNEAITAIKAALEAKDEKQKPVNIKKVAEEHGINLPTEFVPKHDESKAAIQSLTDQCAALIWERDELQKQMWRSEKQEPVACRACNGSGRMVRDPDIGTDQECFVCEGLGVFEDTTPPQRTWVGLTNEEIYKIYRDCGDLTVRIDVARAIEAAHGIKE